MSADQLEAALAELEAAVPLLRRLVTERRVREAVQAAVGAAVEEAVEEATACAVCQHHLKDTRLSCGHLLCHACSQRVQACPLCCATITKRLQIFL